MPSAAGIALLSLTIVTTEAGAAVLLVPEQYATIQEAITAAEDGDAIDVNEGTYTEDIDFLGKNLQVRGSGQRTVLRGTGSGPVVSFVNGETTAAVIDSLVITGGLADNGGGILIADSSPTVVRTIITRNQARSTGSGIHVGGQSRPLIYNNLISYNSSASGDPHAVQIIRASPVIVNNTIVRNDSNGILTSRDSEGVIVNNVIVRNGSRVDGAVRGRGICDFSGRAALIAFNNFRRNRVSALLRGGRDWHRLRRYQRVNPDDMLIFGNVDGRPGFRGRPRRNPERTTYDDFLIEHEERRGRRSRAADHGDPDPACNDLDGTRNDIGFSGGPFAAGSLDLPQTGDCGLQ